MANLKVKDADGTDKYIASTGAGSSLDPYVPEREVVQSAHDDLNANVNLQVADADVGAANPVPVEPGTGATFQLAANSGVDIGDVDVLSGATGAYASAVSVSSVATLVASATTGRKKISIHANSGSRVYLGYDNTLTAGATGKNIGWLDAGDAWEEDFAGAVYAITESGTAYVSYGEVS